MTFFHFIPHNVLSAVMSALFDVCVTICLSLQLCGRQVLRWCEETGAEYSERKRHS